MASKTRLIIRPERCKGCEICLSFCNKQLLSVSNTFNQQGYRPVSLLSHERCNGCGACVLMCPDLALYLEGSVADEQSINEGK
ncbi:4Fe-4S dicluster domain-containing protein [Zhaonella formicivorans]|uniref:4Fe-4S dicluster domain-containing protein n=1 Tax=Zhaonella formicivorans TaxID=2528593 RepID=UPI001D1078F7